MRAYPVSISKIYKLQRNHSAVLEAPSTVMTFTATLISFLSVLTYISLGLGKATIETIYTQAVLQNPPEFQYATQLTQNIVVCIKQHTNCLTSK